VAHGQKKRNRKYSLFNPEELANWYLRLNRLLTIGNFVLHPKKPGSQRTDADAIVIPFSSRKEFPWKDQLEIINPWH
jgi:hypothetical protein